MINFFNGDGSPPNLQAEIPTHFGQLYAINIFPSKPPYVEDAMHCAMIILQNTEEFMITPVHAYYKTEALCETFYLHGQAV